MTVKTKQTTTPKTNNQTNLVYAVVGLAVVVVLGIIVLINSNTSSLSAEVFAEIPKSRTADGAFVLGNPDAPITIVEFADFYCPACQDYKPVINDFITNQVASGKAKLEFRMLVTAGGARMEAAGKLAVCAEEQREGAFWESYELMFDMAKSGELGASNGNQRFAEKMGLDYAELLTCSRDVRQVSVDENFARRLGVSSTPTVLVRYGNGEPQPIPANYNRNQIGQLADSYQP